MGLENAVVAGVLSTFTGVMTYIIVSGFFSDRIEDLRCSLNNSRNSAWWAWSCYEKVEGENRVLVSENKELKKSLEDCEGRTEHSESEINGEYMGPTGGILGSNYSDEVMIKGDGGCDFFPHQGSEKRKRFSRGSVVQENRSDSLSSASHSTYLSDIPSVTSCDLDYDEN